jgi:hypothetical protein
MIEKHLSGQFEGKFHIVSAKADVSGQAFNELGIFGNQNTVCKPQAVPAPMPSNDSN